MGMTSSLRTERSVSPMSRSRVKVTEPSREFSMGTTPSSASPDLTAEATAGMDANGTRRAEAS